MNSLSAVLEGILIPSPPNLAGMEKRLNSRSLGEGRPVSSGTSLDRMALSRGSRRS